MASVTLSSETAASMIADAVRQSIEHEIEKAVRAQIEPRIKQICAEKAAEVCRVAEVTMHRNVSDPFGKISLHISFNGEQFDLASIGK
jgi:hypothetical protein